MSRCDSHTYGECSCRASGIPCRVAPAAIEILRQSNNKAAKQDAFALVLLAAIVFAIIIGLGAQAGPINV
jgi:hypothetical protein